MKKKLVIGIFITISILSIAMNPLSSTNIRVELLGVPDTSNFPDVSFSFRALTSAGYNFKEISADQVQVSENNTNTGAKNLVKNPNGAGLNLYIVIDEFNRTDSELVALFLRRLASYTFLEGFDNLTIVTNNYERLERDNPYVALPKTSSINTITTFASGLSSRRDHQYVNMALAETYSIILDDNQRRTQPTHIILLVGPDTIYQSDRMIADVDRLTGLAGVPLHVFELQHPVRGFINSSVFKDLADTGNGKYFQIMQADKRTQEFSMFDEPFFDFLNGERMTYTLEYRSKLGIEGNRNVVLGFQDLNIVESAGGIFNYSVNLLPPEIELKQPLPNSQIVRTASQDMGGTFIYDKDMQTIVFDVLWPDQYPRNIVSIDLGINTPIGSDTTRLPRDPLSKTFSYEWDLRKISQEGDNPVEILVTVTDELGLTNGSNPVAVTVSNVIPPELTAREISPEVQVQIQRVNIISYVLAGIVIILIISLILLRKKIKNLDFKSIGDSIVNQVRKTFLPNSGKKDPVAMIRIITGPENLIGEELNIFTESVKLGRDPAQADFAFFNPDSKSTVSGLHAEIRRQNGQWLLENYSSSGETVLNGSRIPDDKPAIIYQGDRIRLGYLAQQCVEFEFGTASSGHKKEKVEARITDVQPLHEAEYMVIPNPTEVSSASERSGRDQFPPGSAYDMPDAEPDFHLENQKHLDGNEVDDQNNPMSPEDFFSQYDN